MATSGTKKPRSSNFSLNDCLVLAAVMGEESSVEGLSFHAYLKHIFTNTITSTFKRDKWAVIASHFKARTDVPRNVLALQKKWDNLVQVHRGLYMDFMQSQRMTGVGPNQKSLSLLTEAVVDVVGMKAANTLGVAACSMDSSMLLLKQLYATTPSTSVSRETLCHTESRRKRFTAYRQFARWCWGFLGKDVRVVLPSCAVCKIRETFPSGDYEGFHFAG